MDPVLRYATLVTNIIKRGDIKCLNISRSLEVTSSCGKLLHSLIVAKNENGRPLRNPVSVEVVVSTIGSCHGGLRETLTWEIHKSSNNTVEGT